MSKGLPSPNSALSRQLPAVPWSWSRGSEVELLGCLAAALSARHESNHGGYVLSVYLHRNIVRPGEQAIVDGC